MKTLLITLLFPALLLAQSDIVPVNKKRSDDTLLTSFATGTKTLTISAAGTLVWTSGATLTGASDLLAALSAQPASANLDTYAAITPSADVQSLLAVDNFNDLRTMMTLVIGTDMQAYDPDLTTWGSISPSSNVQSLVSAANYAAIRTLLGLVINTNVQAYDGDLTTWGTMTPSSNVISFINAGTFTNMRSALSAQAASANLDTFAAIAPSANVQSLLGAADYAAIRTLLGVGGLTIGTTTTSGASAGDILTSDGTQLQKLTPGTGVSTALANAVNGASGLLTYGIIGTSGAKVPLLNASNTFGATQNTQDLTPAVDNLYTVGVNYPGKRYYSGSFSGPVNAAYYQMGPSGCYVYPSVFASKQGFRFTDANGTDSAPLMIGPATSSYPALNNSGSTLLVRLGDNSGYTALIAGAITASTSLTVGSTGTAHTKIKSGVAVLVAGTVTVSDSDVLETGTAATSSRILVNRMTDGGTVGDSYTITRINATSFSITSKTASISQTADTSTVSWLMLNP